MSFVVPEEGLADPASFYRRLVDACEEFAHLKDGEPVVQFLLKEDPVFRQGRQVLGSVFLPSVQGQLRPLFDWMLGRLFGSMPDFLVVLDKEYWEEADERLREILMYHEMCHMGQAVDKDGVPRFDMATGAPVWCLVGHDVEEFVAVVRRYGAWNTELQALIAAAS